MKLLHADRTPRKFDLLANIISTLETTIIDSLLLCREIHPLAACLTSYGFGSVPGMVARPCRGTPGVRLSLRCDNSICDLWLACYTQQEIANTVGTSKMEVSRICNEMAGLPKSLKPAAKHLEVVNENSPVP